MSALPAQSGTTLEIRPGRSRATRRHPASLKRSDPPIRAKCGKTAQCESAPLVTSELIADGDAIGSPPCLPVDTRRNGKLERRGLIRGCML